MKRMPTSPPGLKRLTRAEAIIRFAELADALLPLATVNREGKTTRHSVEQIGRAHV